MTDPMTTERLAEIEARTNAATEGPWEERWLQIPGFDGYEVSDFGNVRSYYRKGNHREKRVEFPRTLAKRAKRGGKYPSVSLPVGGSYGTKRIHRLVMLAFVGPCPDGHEVAHLNGDATDNRLANLAYVTHVENESHKARHGTSGAGESNSNAAMQGWQIAEIKYLAGKSVPQGKIAALFGIDHKQVSSILRGKSWACEPARTDIPALIAEVRRLQAAAERVRALHVPFRIYDECECDDTTTPGHVDVEDVGITCNLLYTACRECCTSGVDYQYQTEDCACGHDHRATQCPTIAALDGDE